MKPQPEPMLASDIVEELQKLITTHGNLHVTFDDDGKFVRGVQIDEGNELHLNEVRIFILGW